MPTRLMPMDSTISRWSATLSGVTPNNLPDIATDWRGLAHHLHRRGGRFDRTSPRAAGLQFVTRPATRCCTNLRTAYTTAEPRSRQCSSTVKCVSRNEMIEGKESRYRASGHAMAQGPEPDLRSSHQTVLGKTASWRASTASFGTSA
jgi:hypothetical protein